MFRIFALLMLVFMTACQTLAPASPTPTLTPVPSSTPTLAPTAQPTAEATENPPSDPEATEEPALELVITPLVGEGAPPPFTIDLPEGWKYSYDTLTVLDIDAGRTIPLAVYQGPVSNNEAIGTIVLLWGFPNLIAFDPGSDDVNLWSDGLRLLRLTLVEEGCNLGTDLQRSYRIGNRAATGTQFSIVDCPETQDTRGWFAGLQEDNLNFVFFMYVEPIDQARDGLEELQTILDSVRFHALTTGE